jgi:hypothetical protein
MTKFGYPKYGKSQSTGKIGESYFDTFVHHELGWIYRSTHQESDFGIDGYIDIVTDGNVTGKTIGVQIKCGDSYFDNKSEGGIRFNGDNKHLNYYINCPYPIILIVLNGDCTKGRWVEFNVSVTSSSGSGWWIELPRKNVLSSSVKGFWEIVAGPISDNDEGISLSWKANKALDKADFGTYLIHQNDILACDFTGINDVINRLSRNKASLLKNRGTLEILISGYDEDPRESYEIPEIRHWFQESLKEGIPWFYFLGEQANGMGITVLLFSCCDIEVKYKEAGNSYVEILNSNQVQGWLDSNFHNLNTFSEEREIPESVNREMSEKAVSLVTGNFVEN